ncbi:diisopropyl-fluorophosphatase-like isoform X2 [Gigantopelta aegis]|uniref:diisopropyl-fluorophosphatase-like isoform X2 n=1 Tax=Gigantopelta aegis TaxID=1735272 RepID=UPI001B88E550|nr:diisopropyl-fluorophosphatase-like isoform X2 [Gigantopelta aegis]
MSSMAASKHQEVQLVEPQFSKIVEGLRGAEGPVFDNHGQFFMVAPEVEKDGKYAGQILKVDLETGKTTILCEPSVDGFGGIPAGCQCDHEGNLWVADMRLGIIKVTQKGEMTQICTKDSEGRTMQGCNDCAFDYHGNLWVTAPAGEIAPHPYRRSNEEPFGSIYCVTNQGVVVKIDTGFLFPNGIAVLHDDDGCPKTLIVAETPTKRLWGFDIVGSGRVDNKRIWGQLSGDFRGPDGIDFDKHNNLLVTYQRSGSIEVFPPGGGWPVKSIRCPFTCPSNLHFRPGSRDVYVTEHQYDGLWRFEWECGGKPQMCDLDNA